MEKTYNLVELFSGIGSQAKALKNIASQAKDLMNLDISVNIQGTCEWDVHALSAYDVIHNSPEIPKEIDEMSKDQLLKILCNYTFSNSGKAALEFSALRTYSEESLKRIYTSIVRNKNFVDVTRLEGANLPDNVDIMTYSFPCQDLSNVGAFHGYTKGIDKNSGSRSSLLWQVGRILTEMKSAGKNLPRFLLLENVPTLLSKRHLGNFQTWISDLEDLGYISHYYQLNSTSFGLPQNRPRLLMISVHVGEDTGKWHLVHKYFKQHHSAEDIVSAYRESGLFTQYTVQDLLRLNYTNKKIKAEAESCTPNDTPSRRKIWEENPQIIREDGTFNPDIDAVRTITTKQDRNPNSGNLYFDSGIEGRSKFRYLTPRECLLFMGFTDSDFNRLKKNNVEFHKDDALFSRDKMIRMAGNSIPVKLLEGVFYQIIQIDQQLDNYLFNKEHTASTTITEDYSKLIKHGMYPWRIRSRLNKHTIYPENATVIYPKFKTAIYVINCFSGDQATENIPCTLCAHAYWKKRCEKKLCEAENCYQDALKMGWNVVVVRPCEFNIERRDGTFQWIAECVKAGLSNTGVIYQRG